MNRNFFRTFIILVLLLVPSNVAAATGNESLGEVLIPSEQDNRISSEEVVNEKEEELISDFQEEVKPGIDKGEQRGQETVPVVKSNIDKSVIKLEEIGWKKQDGPIATGNLTNYPWTSYGAIRIMTDAEQPLMYSNARGKGDGYTDYPYTSGYLYIEVTKDGAIGVYRLDCWVEHQTWVGSQQVYYSISHVSGVDFGLRVADGSYYTEADGGVDEGWLPEERQYAFPINLEFTDYGGYKLYYNIEDSDFTQFYGGVYGNILSATYTTNCVGITNWWDGVNYLHDTVRVYYKKNDYTLTYDGNGATSGNIGFQSYEYGSAFQLKSGFSRTGHTFKGYAAVRASDNSVYCGGYGWQTLSSAVGSNPVNWTLFQPGSENVINEYWINTNVKDDTFRFYAQWQANTYTIQYNGNGASSGSVSPFNVGYGNGFYLSNGYAKTGYTLKGYAAVRASDNAVYCGGNGWQSLSSTVGSNPANWSMYQPGTYNTINEYWTNTSVGNDIFTFYAQWTANTYKIQFNGNGATSGSTAGKTATYDTAITLPTNGFSKTGHTFIGWNTKADGTGIKYNNTASVSNLTSVNRGTVTLYAQWQRNKYKVTYNYNYNGGDSTSKSSDEVFYEYAVNLSPTAVKAGDTGKYSTSNPDGWQFVGWNTNASATSGVSALKMGASDITLYAIYKKVITATYVDYAENVRKESKIVKTVYNRNTTADCSTNVQNAITGWNHGGWCTGTNPTSNVITNFSINKDTIFYGKYYRTLTQRFVNFKSVNELTGTQYCNSFAINVRSNVNLTTPIIQTKADWTAQGWAKEDTANAKKVYGANQAVAFQESGTYYAIYKRIYSVSYDTNGGTTTPEVVKVTALYNASGDAFYPEVKIAPAIIKYGTDFQTWNTSKGGGGKNYESGSVIEVSGDLNLFAKFEDTEGSSIELSEDSIVIEIGEKVDIEAVVKPDNAKNTEFAWESADSKVATVNNDGTIVGKATGKTTITVTYNSKEPITAVIEVTVVGCTVKVPATMVLGTPTVLTVSVNSNNSAGKEAKLILNEMSSLKGVNNLKEYELEAEFSDDNTVYRSVTIGEPVIVTKSTKDVFFKVTPFVSVNSLVSDSYTAAIQFRLELQ